MCIEFRATSMFSHSDKPIPFMAEDQVSRAVFEHLQRRVTEISGLVVITCLIA
jgi:hypothetical protein